MTRLGGWRGFFGVLVITLGLSFVFAFIISTLIGRLNSGAKASPVVAIITVVLWAVITYWSLGRELRG